jgi:phage terminase large subunit GpA-like protein
MRELAANEDQFAWLEAQFASLPQEHVVVTPSAWAEAKRYLTPATTHLAGPFRFDVTPYLREIVDCLSVDSPVREVIVMKGVQLGVTVGVLENVLGYFIEHIKNAPCMMVTADSELAKLRVDQYITPMLQNSGLMRLIQSSDEKNSRKTGKTEKRIEWEGGGFLIPQGAVNANKLRSASIQLLLRDEIDGWPETVGRDGDPLKLSAARCAAYSSSRKILDISTPLLEGTSKIESRFLLGDQRYYHVRCLHCEHLQVLRWKRTHEGGVISGIVWELDNHGHIVPDSVRYLCERCQHPHMNEDKPRLLSPDYGALWVPTAVPTSRDIRSYHLSALYSPMESWLSCAGQWVECWDDANNRPKKISAVQTFYNNVLGRTYTKTGEKVSFEAVSGHRRSWYSFGEIPNLACEEFCGGPVLVVVCTVDVHGDHLAVSTWGWCRDQRPLLLDYERVYGDTENIDDPATWGELDELICSKIYVADDGREYMLSVTMIDSGYRADQVYRFCARYEGGVYPVKGRAVSPKNQRDREFSDMTTPMGTMAYGITVDYYKDRWAPALRRGDWSGLGIQPEYYFNAPIDITDKQLKELTVETKVAVIDTRTKERIGWEWKRPSGAANELWDLLVYANAAFDLVAWDYCIHQLKLEAVNWHIVYEHLLEQLPPLPPTA